MSEQSASVQELIWLASYYKRIDMPDNAQLILDSIEHTKHSTDEWAPIRYIEKALAKLNQERKSA